MSQSWEVTIDEVIEIINEKIENKVTDTIIIDSELDTSIIEDQSDSIENCDCNDINEEIIDIINKDDIKNKKDDIEDKKDIIEDKKDIIEDKKDDIDVSTDCLALIVRENYQMTIVKNLIKKTARFSWKIVLSIFTINLLNLFL